MKTNNVDFGKSFKFKTDCQEHDLIYTCNAVDDKGECVISWDWGLGDGVESTEYMAVTIEKFIKEGSWIVLPSDTTDYTRECIDKLNAWVGCMSYNDSYFGEPAGMLKSNIRQLDKTYKEGNSHSTKEIVGDIGPELSFQTNGRITDSLLNEIKSFTTTSKHSVNIYNGAYEVFRSGEDVAYQCKDDTSLRSVMQALKVLDGVVHD